MRCEDGPLAPVVAQEAERLLLDHPAAPEGGGGEGDEDGERGEGLSAAAYSSAMNG